LEFLENHLLSSTILLLLSLLLLLPTCLAMAHPSLQGEGEEGVGPSHACGRLQRRVLLL
jgi:hypothetical protein